MELYVVEYEMTEELYQKASKLAAIGLRRIMLLFFSLFMLLESVTPFIEELEEGAMPLEAGLACGLELLPIFFIFVLIYKITWKIGAKRQYRQMCAMYGTHRKCIAQEGVIVEQTEKSSIRHSYENVKCVIENQELLILTTGNQIPIYMIVIPKHGIGAAMSDSVCELILQKCVNIKKKIQK